MSLGTKLIIGFGCLIGFSMCNAIVSSSDRASQKSAEESALKAEQEKVAQMSPEARKAYEDMKKEEAERIAAQKIADEERKKSDEELRDARYACRDLVIQSLHDPDSADIERASHLYWEKKKNGSYFIQVVGRAKNGFGALRKLTVNCTIKKLPNGNWKAISVKEI